MSIFSSLEMSGFERITPVDLTFPERRALSCYWCGNVSGFDYKSYLIACSLTNSMLKGRTTKLVVVVILLGLCT